MNPPKPYFGHPRPEMLRFVPPGARRILDVGCGAGAFLSNFDEDVVRVGIEPDIAASAAARQHANLVLTGLFEEGTARAVRDAGYADFDCITFNDVLEHMIDPGHALALARPLLAPGGVVVASMPNFLFYSNIWNILRTQDFRYEPAGIMDATHLRFFTRKSMVRLFQGAGFEVTHIEGITSVTSLKFRLVNALALGRISDFRVMQFAIVARPAPPDLT